MVSLLKTLQWLPIIFRIKIWIKILPCWFCVLPLPSYFFQITFIVHYTVVILASSSWRLLLMVLLLPGMLSLASSHLLGPPLKSYPFTKTFPYPPWPIKVDSLSLNLLYFLYNASQNYTFMCFHTFYCISLLPKKKKASWG